MQPPGIYVRVPDDVPLQPPPGELQLQNPQGHLMQPPRGGFVQQPQDIQLQTHRVQNGFVQPPQPRGGVNVSVEAARALGDSLRRASHSAGESAKACEAMRQVFQQEQDAIENCRTFLNTLLRESGHYA